MTKKPKKSAAKKENEADLYATPFDPTKPNRFTWGPEDIPGLRILYPAKPLPTDRDDENDDLDSK